MSQNKKISIALIAAILLAAFILLLILISIKKNDGNTGMYGNISEGTTVQSDVPTDTAPVDSSHPLPAMPLEQEVDPSQDIFPENVNFLEESLSGGGIPQKFTDSDGNEYTKKYFPSLGYLMYIPDNWERKEHSDSYLQNIYYLISDKEGYEDIQISVATKTATKGMSSSEVRNLFKTTHNNMEYYFRNGEYKFITTMYESGSIHQITTNDIPGFESLDNTILVYYDEPEVTFLMEKEPTYYVEPYVINYYMIKDNVAVMLTVIGPRKQAMNMNYLLTAMGLNCKELYNTNATRIHYKADKLFKSRIMQINAPSEWNASIGNGIINRIKCSDDETNALFGTEVLYSSSLISDPSIQSPEDVLSDSAVTSSIAYSSLDFTETIPGNVLQNLDYSIKYSPKDVSEIFSGGSILTKIDFTCTIDETSLWHQLALIENPFHATAYIKKCSNGYAFVIIKYNAVNESYIDSLTSDILANTDWPD